MPVSADAQIRQVKRAAPCLSCPLRPKTVKINISRAREPLSERYAKCLLNIMQFFLRDRRGFLVEVSKDRSGIREDAK